MQWFKSCVAAFRFLTILPLPTSFGCDSKDLDNSAFFFPVVGMFLGGFAALAAWGLWKCFPPLVAASSITIILLSFSGALHLDGLADTADGFFSSRTRDKMLVIMRDSRIGVMGVVALFAVLLLKVSSLSALTGSDVLRTAFMMPVAGRVVIVIMMGLLPYARPEGGLATRFYSRRTVWAALFSLVVFYGLYFITHGLVGLLLASSVVVFILLFCVFCYRKIGGATGDTLGAACELSEMSVAFLAVVNL